ncbi:MULTISPECIES: ribosome maturation factor RimM [Okeania]|uniref:Ribosome maturation factor RimM n=1 Tax=Okeania hirsuta TaxID=1458930 RepID=A0A3N6P2S2_9CYAN|nr:MULTISPECIES: ribosome maturation factor RimM [Okeania]NET79842.1 ribosome maturation factor RimM [Okeania sp. SIO1F9]RQH12209.1 ribosome maturation factor RimM [Okeania hirsuta]RQH26170.1 ribosome maturation factor RimM [Okeania hirsuta]
MSEWIEIGRIVAPQGLRGELRVYPNSDFPERFLEPGKRWLLQPGQVDPQDIELLGGRYLPGKELYVIQLAGIENREQAEALRNSHLFVQRGDRPQLGEDEFYLPDLIGLTVINQLNGEIIGKVVSMISAGNDLLEVEKISTDTPIISETITQDKPLQESGRSRRKKNQKKPKSSPPQNLLIPFVKEIVPVVNFEKGIIEIIPPLGLIDL